MKRTLFILSLLAASGLSYAAAQSQASSRSASGISREYRIWSDTPAVTRLFDNQKEEGRTSNQYDGIWEPSSADGGTPTWNAAKGNPAQLWESEGYPIGNGRMGAMVFNGSGRDRYALNEISLWSGGENLGTTNRNGDKKYNGYNANTGGDGFGCYQPFGDFIVDFGAPVKQEGFDRALSLNEAEVTSKGTRKGVTVSSESFVSAPDQVMVFSYKADQPGKLDAKFTFVGQQDGVQVSASGNTVTLKGTLKNGMQFEGQAVVLNNKGTLTANNGVLELKGGDSCVVLVALGTDYVMDYSKHWKGAAPSGKIAKQLAAAKKKSLAELRAAHRKDFSKYFDRVTLNLGTTDAAVAGLPTPKRLDAYKKNQNDPQLEETMFQLGRYLLISSSRPGSLPANLQGLWNGMVSPPWASDYHSNINMQMAYWGAEPTNLPECHLPMMDLLVATEEPNRIATQEYVKATQPDHQGKVRGWTLYTSHNPFGGNGWQVNIPASAWYALHMWEHYNFTQDKAYLKKVYPMMKEICEFWEDHLKELGAGGKGLKTDGKEVDVTKFPELADIKAGTLVAPHGWSPEHGPREDGVAHDQQLIWELFTNTIAAAKTLGVDDAWAKQLAAKRDRLAGPKIGKEGNLMEWMIDRIPRTQHRHTSHLFAVYPGNMINPVKTPELSEAASKSLEWRGTTGDSRRSWTWPWRTALWARFHNGDKAHEMVSGLLQHNTLPNLLTTHAPMQLDGNFGIPGGISEMLLQSHSGQIELLPAPAKAWASGSVKGLKARGNVTVDFTWKDGKVTDYKLTSPTGKKVKLVVNGQTKDVTPQKQK